MDSANWLFTGNRVITRINPEYMKYLLLLDRGTTGQTCASDLSEYEQSLQFLLKEPNVNKIDDTLSYPVIMVWSNGRQVRMKTAHNVWCNYDQFIKVMDTLIADPGAILTASEILN